MKARMVQIDSYTHAHTNRHTHARAHAGMSDRSHTRACKYAVTLIRADTGALPSFGSIYV